MTKKVYNYLVDSSIWEKFKYRESDIVIASYPKSGITWLQQIVFQLIFNGKDVSVWQESPWLDFRLGQKKTMLDILEKQKHRRVIKSHLPAFALPFSPKCKYIYVVRDGRDIAWSYHNQISKLKDDFKDMLDRTYDSSGNIFERKPLGTAHQFFIDWIETDGYYRGSFFEHVKSWWIMRNLPNVLLVHYNQLKSDLKSEILRIAKFLGISSQKLKIDKILEHCSFDYMKKHATLFAPLGGKIFKGGAQSFFHRGANNDWRKILSDEEVRRYEQLTKKRLGNECSYWLATGYLLERGDDKKFSPVLTTRVT